MTGKSRTSGGSQWYTCGGNTLDAKTRPKNAPSSMEMTPKWPIWSQNCRLTLPPFGQMAVLAQNVPFQNTWRFLSSNLSRVVPSHVFRSAPSSSRVHMATA